METHAVAQADVFSLTQVVPQHTAGEQDLKQAVRQFESLFVGMMLKSMRSAGEIFSSGSYLHSPAVATHQELLDQQLAVSLSNRGGIGLAEPLERQLTGDGQGFVRPLRQPAVTPVIRDTQDPPIATRSSGPDALMQAPTAPDSLDSVGGFLDRFATTFETALASTPLNPKVVLAQAALETGWGRHLLEDSEGNPANNLFGIKAAADDAEAVHHSTLEFIDGAPIKMVEAFKRYASFADGLQDYVNLITGNPRYAPAVAAAQDPGAYARALQDGGYATDPDYAAKILSVYHRIESFLAR